MRSLNDSHVFHKHYTLARTSWPDEISGIKEKSYRSRKTRMNIMREERKNKGKKKGRKKKNRNLFVLYIVHNFLAYYPIVLK